MYRFGNPSTVTLTHLDVITAERQSPSPPTPTPSTAIRPNLITKIYEKLFGKGQRQEKRDKRRLFHRRKRKKGEGDVDHGDACTIDSNSNNSSSSSFHGNKEGIPSSLSTGVALISSSAVLANSCTSPPASWDTLSRQRDPPSIRPDSPSDILATRMSSWRTHAATSIRRTEVPMSPPLPQRSELVFSPLSFAESVELKGYQILSDYFKSSSVEEN